MGFWAKLQTNLVNIFSLNLKKEFINYFISERQSIYARLYDFDLGKPYQARYLDALPQMLVRI